MILKNKICLITGSTGGLGFEIINSLILEKVKIIAISKSLTKLNILKKKYKDHIIDVFSCDFENQKEVINVIRKITKKNYKVDILINCAGEFLNKKFNSMSYEGINKNLNINLVAPIFFAKEFTNNMKKNKWGRIINIGSSSSYYGFSETLTYCTSKHGLLGFSRSINEELKKFGVRSYIFSPGSIKTKMGKKVKNQNYNTFIDPKELSELIIYIIKQNNNMITEEIKINRLNYY